MSTEEQPKPDTVNLLSGGLQSQILQFTLDVKKHEDKDYIGFCESCIDRVDRSEMIYKKGHLFHQSCSDQHSGEFPLDNESVNEERRRNVDLAYLKNLEFRNADKKTSKKTSTQTKKKKSLVKKRKSKTKRKSTKKRKTVKKKSKTRKKSTAKRKKTTKRKKVTKKRVKRKSSRKR